MIKFWSAKIIKKEKRSPKTTITRKSNTYSNLIFHNSEEYNSKDIRFSKYFIANTPLLKY
ncbi:MAG: hypothetical protein QY315_06195 [Saprospiraceae bacterium]|nr:MAG: hypothetical protein QY315_06195 [Saprospiraceae bacterium]